MMRIKENSPAIMVVTINVEDLLALDAKHAVKGELSKSSPSFTFPASKAAYPERIHSVKPTEKSRDTSQSVDST